MRLFLAATYNVPFFLDSQLVRLPNCLNSKPWGRS